MEDLWKSMNKSQSDSCLKPVLSRYRTFRKQITKEAFEEHTNTEKTAVYFVPCFNWDQNQTSRLENQEKSLHDAQGRAIQEQKKVHKALLEIMFAVRQSLITLQNSNYRGES